MKKLIVTLAIVMIANISFSQLLPFTFGPRLGYTSSHLATNLKDVSGIKEDIRHGLIGGAFARLTLKQIYIQMDAYIAFKGGKYNYDYISVLSGLKTNYNYNIKLTTIDIPLLFGYKLINLPMVNLRMHAGPVMSRIISKDVDFKITNPDGSSIDRAFHDSFKQNIWAIQAGLGMDVFKFSLDVRYELGLNNIGKTADDVKKSNVFLVTLGYKIL